MATENKSLCLMSEDLVHKICSGQVILSISMAMKELVENSIDAGSNIINITCKEYGSERLEVCDNGKGIPEVDFDTLALKHYTSKIKDFKDLDTISTLGFRGEALSSICALSEELVVTTKHDNSNSATKLLYDKEGKIIQKSIIARERGTTVAVKNIFATLPVRRKEFLRNLKKEFNKMCQLLYAYCLVSERIKFTCINIKSNGSKDKIVATEGGKAVKDNIIALFGSKQLSNLIEIDIVSPDKNTLTEYGVDWNPENELPFLFQFMISSVRHGNTKNSQDKQFYYINSRPCEPTKIIKLVNDLYKQYNAKQVPFVYLNILLKTHEIDVNITPDKRQIYFQNEKLLLATLKSSLLENFKNYPCTFPLQNILTQSKICEERGVKRRALDENGGKVKTLNLNKSDHPDKCNFNKLEYSSINCFSKVDNKSHINTNGKENEAKNNFLENILEVCTSKMIVNRFCITYIKQKLKQKVEAIPNNHNIKFKSKILPEYNKNAEEELQTQLSNTDFMFMDVIGQFNLGFIITKLYDDLFIIDQHASDENYNYNMLLLNSTIESQVLVKSKRLILSATNERMLIENEEIFRKNGFVFKVDKSAQPTERILLTAVPISSKYTFGHEEIDEMLAMLQDSSTAMCRPSTIRSIFASKACRKSVMIGKALSMPDMQEIVNQMSRTDEPWNCPHGRPTMRHLMNINNFLI